MKTVIVMGCAALMLAGCDKGAEQAATGPMSAKQVADAMDSVKLEPGEWEATQEIVDVKMTGVPEGMPAEAMKQMIGQKNTVKHCVTPEQAANPGADFLAAQKDAKCTYSDMRMAGGTIKGAMTCSPPDNPKATMKMTMNGTYLPASYAMAMETELTGMPNGMAMQMKMKTSGKRIGACPEGSGTDAKISG
ncbi:DUF3617 domain-containing protein [Sphingobium algorifonticola]|nr:DUF3617 domain-containing protein [Sphingobium algorifonticola]